MSRSASPVDPEPGGAKSLAGRREAPPPNRLPGSAKDRATSIYFKVCLGAFCPSSLTCSHLNDCTTHILNRITSFHLLDLAL